MAYSSNPLYSSYKTQQFNFIGNPLQRSGSSTKDQRFVNFFPELLDSPINGDKQYYLTQRAGLVYQQSTATGVGRGVYYYNGSIFSVVGNTLYRNSSSLQVLSTSTGTVGFVEYQSDTAKYLIVLDGTSGWTVDASNAVVQITDVDFPSPHCVHGAYIDGYLCVAKAGTADIYTCVLNNVFSWLAGDFITAEMFPDNISALVRQSNYIVAVGTQTIEYFYDAGTTPGTPLAANKAAQHQIGTASPDTVLINEEEVMFVGQTGSGGRTVWAFSGFQPREISTPPVRESLDAEGSSISSVKGFCIRSKGHRFLVLNLTSVTWVYDFDTSIWHQWADYTGSSKFNCDFASDHPNGYPLMLDRATGYAYLLDPSVSTDATGVATTSNITCTAISQKINNGSMNRKFMSRFTLVGDVPAASNGASFSLLWSDDDYQTWSTPRTIVIGDTMPTTTQLGSYRRRAFKIVYATAYPWRFEGFEADINVGSQ